MIKFKNQSSFLITNIQIIFSIIILFFLISYKFTYFKFIIIGLIFLNLYFLIYKYLFPDIIYIDNDLLSVMKGRKKYDFDLNNLEYLKWHKSFMNKINDTVSLILKSHGINEINLKLNSFSDQDMKQIINEINKTFPGKIM